MASYIENHLEQDETIIYQWKCSSITLRPAEFALTNKRVISRSGTIFRSTQHITLDTLKAVYLESYQFSFEKKPQSGTLIFEGPGNGVDIFSYITESPIEFARKIYDYLGWSEKILVIIKQLGTKKVEAIKKCIISSFVPDTSTPKIKYRLSILKTIIIEQQLYDYSK